MTEKPHPDGLPTPRKKYTPAFKAECVRQVAAGARQSDVACAHRARPGLDGRHHLLTLARQALMLPGHLARYLFSAGRGLAPGRADAHRTRAAGSGAGPDPAPARAGAPRPRRPRQPIHQRRLPRPHRPTALPLLRSKKPAWKWLITSIPPLISTGAIPPWVTAHPTHLNRT